MDILNLLLRLFPAPLAALIPGLLIATGMAALYVYTPQLPPELQQLLPWLPYLLLVLVVALASFYNLSRLFYFAVIVALNGYWLLHQADVSLWAADVVFLASLLATLVLAVLPEKGLFNLAGWLTHLMMMVFVSLPIGLMARNIESINNWLNPAVLPPSWLDWSPLGVTAWSFGLLLVIGLSWSWVRTQQRTHLNALWVAMVVLLMHHLQQLPLVTALLASAAFLLLLIHALQDAWQLAYVDELTGLPGRRALQERLQRSLGIYALAMVDVDHFKQFNDQYGHDVGDEVLRMIAAKINQVAGGGKAYRYGGEEFTIVFNNHSADEIKPHLLAVIETIADTPFVVNRRQNQKPKAVQVTVSMGLTDSINHPDAAATIKTADQALYTAKKRGRNRLVTKGT